MMTVKQKKKHQKIKYPGNINDDNMELFQQPKIVKLPSWRWKELSDYNGFTGQERINGWRLVKFLIAQKIVENPVGKPCEICGTIHETNYHNENYYQPWKPYILCKQCHFALHNRLKGKWNEWQELINKHSKTQDEWFMNLSSEKIDMAGKLREKHGNEIADIIKNCKLIPEGIKVVY
jgi:hypothetical protein